MSHHGVAMGMSVGAGLVLAAVSLKVAADAIRMAGPVAAALSLLLGAAVFSASNALLAQFGAAHRKRCGECMRQPAESQRPRSGVAIAFGTALPPQNFAGHPTGGHDSPPWRWTWGNASEGGTHLGAPPPR